MRGQRMPPVIRGIQYRIIPARAGPTRAKNWLLENTPDHPRSCGANVFVCCVLYCSYGSSPLVRGQRVLSIAFGTPERIIPARAGPTQILSFNSALWADHPRSCGANAIAGVYDKIHLGSSPLVRGQQANTYGSQTTARIIPARAGPTYRGTTSGGTGSDHPRSCGANGQVRVHFNDAFGSSPLVRGQPHALQGLQVTGRIIPARAGPTHPGYGRTRTWPDHPRSCGANTPAVL